MILTPFFHSPVLLPEVITGLNISAGKKYIDATIGGGGYSVEILRRGGLILGIDVDQDALDYVRKKFQIDKKIFLVRGNFADLTKIAVEQGFLKVAGIVFDFGMSSYQIDKSGRGFSFGKDEPLDMRMDLSSKITVADLVNKLTTEELYEIFIKYAEELNSRPIAEAISRTRSLKGEIKTTWQLAAIIDETIRRVNTHGKAEFRHSELQRVKARIFQAFRITVNNELNNIKNALGQAIDLLESKGRIAVLSYHSLEDRIVKRIFRDAMRKGLMNIITTKPVRANWQEIRVNPRSKSVRLRIAEKK